MKTFEYGKDDLEIVLRRDSPDYSGLLDYVAGIVKDVRRRGDRALLEYTEKFDKVKLDSLRVGEEQIQEAYSRVDISVIEALEHAHSNIESLHTAQYQRVDSEWSMVVEDGVTAGERMTPVSSVGCYVPGGRAAYPSTLLMTATPAEVVGVERVVVASPPPISDVVLAACKVVGVDEVYMVGGPHGIAALAYGTESVSKVDKIVGPGNKYVTAAKMLVYGEVDIDMPAGPSEVLIVADDSADPEFIASDVMAQAEHDPDAKCVLVTDSKSLVGAVKSLVETQKTSSKRIEIISKSIDNFSIIKTKSISDSLRFANDYAAEHVEIIAKSPDDLSKKIVNAGAIFIGPYSPVAAGDYASGGNHVLPTGGAARFSSQLSVRDYLKSTSVQKITRKGLKSLSKTIRTLAEEEGLMEHSKSVEKRL
ncbi:MAG: histidinol dehydrogenase [Candidatus Altiarchaeales archaeon]|nr:histidinol dehydrogenase [Candidatus Altiarchaeales archaeon]MBD3416595.1 histidinol dehydrogenase [Candidatus Altiarchaeales archaeon]